MSWWWAGRRTATGASWAATIRRRRRWTSGVRRSEGGFRPPSEPPPRVGAGEARARSGTPLAWWLGCVQGETVSRSSSKTGRRVAAVWMAAVVVAFAGPAGAQQIRIGATPAVTFVVLYAAEQLGYFKGE